LRLYGRSRVQGKASGARRAERASGPMVHRASPGACVSEPFTGLQPGGDAGSSRRARLRQRSPKTGGQRNALLVGVAQFLPPIQPVVRIAREHVKMVVPHILIAGRPVVLARGDAFAAEGGQHRVRQAPRGAEDLVAQVVRHVQHVLVVATRDHQAVAVDAGVVVRRHQGVHVGIHQDNGRFRRRRGQRGGDTAERTVVPGGSVLHEAQRRREPTVGRERILWRAPARRQSGNAAAGLESISIASTQWIVAEESARCSESVA